MSELRKVVNSLLQDKISAEDCRKALNEIDSMGQAVKDLTKAIDGLRAEKAGLITENAKSLEAVADAKKEAEIITAEAKSLAEQEKKQAKATANKLLGDAVLEADKQKQESHRLKTENADWSEKNRLAKEEHDTLLAGIEAMKAQAKAFAGA